MINVVEEEEKLLVKLHLESSHKDQHVLSLRAFEIIDFSSQYGNEDSLSYTAENFLGPPAVYPRAGDHAYTFQLRTYGEWWINVPSFPSCTINLPVGSPVESQDFIEFRVERRIIPILMRIYEVYNPGAIVKIFAFCYDNERWVVLWQGEPEFLIPNQSHCFSVHFEGIHFLSDFYRIEFHHKHLKYFCELDGLILYGENKFPLYFPSYNIPKSNFPRFAVAQAINNHVYKEDKSNSFIEDSQSFFYSLPQEVVLNIMSYLDLQSLCNAASVSRLFKKACYDPMLYKDLNLQIYWHLVDVFALRGLQPRLKTVKSLNMSWCGGQGRITPPHFIEFLEATYKQLTILKISCCPFINNTCMKFIAHCCNHLEVLEMRGCHARDLTQTGFKCISLMPKLKYLDLYRTYIDTSSLLTIIMNCSNLQHLFLGSCANIDDFNEVSRAISFFLKNIKTLDFWRAVSLTCAGITELAKNCHNLVELDLGWCYKVDASCGCLKQLIKGNPQLKKLYLSAIRSVSNNEVNAVATYCKQIEQLDILGISEVNLETCERFLQSCRHLKLLDVSYCDNSVKEAVQTLQEKFPSVEIKCSFPPLPDMNYS